ncbi:MAG TPA: MATE family efflux transporter [Steroidobacteraceae bacterium]|nr:MATE family efflux transporter [Steroidobacteraceae bacterium]
MKDLSTGSIPGHIATMSITMAIGIFVQTLYFFIDLFFVSKLGDHAIAGVTSAGNLWFVVLALTQILNVGTVALVSHAVGAQQRDRANLVFNQSLLLSIYVGLFVIGAVYLAAPLYMHTVGADAETANAGIRYLYWFAPGLGLQFAMVAMFATLRGTGIVKPTMILQMVTVFVNVILAPVLIVGWGTGKPMGTAGAGLASTISVIVGVILSAYYFHKHEKYVSVHREQMKPQMAVWGRLLHIGLPVGLEFFLMSVAMAIVYWLIRDFGASAQAGFGVGQGVMRIIMLPAMAVAFASAPIAGQNFGARKPERVRETFKWTAIISVILMSLLTVLCQFESNTFMHVFTQEAAVVAVGAQMLLISSWNFAANGLIFSCSSMFQALGNTWPTIGSSAIRLVLFAVPAFWLASRPGFEIHHLWYVSVCSMFLQAVVSLLLVRREFGRRLNPVAAPVATAA